MTEFPYRSYVYTNNVNEPNTAYECEWCEAYLNWLNFYPKMFQIKYATKELKETYGLKLKHTGDYGEYFLIDSEEDEMNLSRFLLEWG